MQYTAVAKYGDETKTASFTLEALTIAPPTIVPPAGFGPFTAAGTLTLNARPAAGRTVTLTSSNPNVVRFGKVKVTWLVNNPPACYKIDTFSITAMLRGTGGTKSKSETVSGSPQATEIVFDNFPVSADFKPGVIVANVKATGTARITGSAQNETQLN